MFNTFIAISLIALQLFLIILVISWVIKAPILRWFTQNVHTISRVVFLGALAGSLIYSEYFEYPPCILCWYQRLTIFPIALLLCTANLRKSALLRTQVLLFSVFGFAVALFHTYIDIFQPNGVDICGADGISCSARYVYEFGFVTIPLMSATVLLAGIVLTLLARRYPQDRVATSL